jgi:hypothetical protein
MLNTTTTTLLASHICDLRYIIFHALLVGQLSRPVRLIGSSPRQEISRGVVKQILGTILARVRHRLASCMNGSCEAGESRPYPPIVPLRSSFISPAHPCHLPVHGYQVPFLKWPGQSHNSHVQYNTPHLEV